VKVDEQVTGLSGLTNIYSVQTVSSGISTKHIRQLIDITSMIYLLPLICCYWWSLALEQS